jgi:uncharacterized protein YqjF (DUF2071 family)
MAQTWCDLLFTHWPIPAEALRRVVPPQLELDLWEGDGWVGVVPFRMQGIRPRFGCALPILSATPEINVRTYVKRNGKAGVYFFSLDAASALVVWGARRFFGLPYFRARMESSIEGDAIRYRSQRSGAEFRALYRPTGPIQPAQPGTLDYWLTERYCLHTAEATADIYHGRWPLQPAEAEIEINTMAEAAGIALPPIPPLLHFARRLDVHVAQITGLRTNSDSRNDAGVHPPCNSL